MKYLCVWVLKYEFLFCKKRMSYKLGKAITSII